MKTALLIALATSLLGCGANFQHAQCRTTYDDCVNQCASRCQDDRLPVDGDSEGASVNTWNSECQTCESMCRGLAERCESDQAR